MQIGKYLETKQPIIYRTFVRALESNHLSHAYLISGNPGTPLLEVAKYLAKSILCDTPNPLACDDCLTCIRVDDENYPDLVVLDGSKNNIKKEQVKNIESRFDKSALEIKGIMIYIIHLVENMGSAATNSILKFLEEPEDNVYAFLTTNNENNVLPTIISRCQLMRLKPVDRRGVIQEAVDLNIPKEDAELLSYFYNDAELIFDILNKGENKGKAENYLDAKEAFLEFLECLKKEDKREAIYFAQTSIIPLLKAKESDKAKESARFFLDMLVEGFEDMLNIKQGKSPFLESYATILQELSQSLNDIDGSLLEILKDRNLINLNVNTSLLIDHLVFKILKEE